MRAPSAPTPAQARALSFDEFHARSHIGGLDGFRGIAILLVLFHHVNRAAGDPLAILRENGRYGVSLFFIVSGFLITTLFLREERERGSISLWRFYARRALRLFPLYYLALAIQTAAVFGTHLYSAESVATFVQKLPSYVFYYSNLLPNATEGPFFFAWSLAVEEQFYLWFGVFMVFVPRRILVTGLVALLVTKFAAFQLFGQLDTRGTAWRIAFSYQEPLLWGVLLGFTLGSRRGYAAVARVVHAPLAAWGLILFCVAWLSLRVVQSANVWDGELLFLALTLGIAGAATAARVPVLANPVLAHIGRVSYGIYLLHWFVYTAANRFLPPNAPTLFFLVSASAAIVAASVSFRYFEQPIRNRYKRALAAKPRGDGLAGEPAIQQVPA